MVPRARDRAYVLECVDAVKKEIPGLPLHVFGLGHPDFLSALYSAGVDSVDSSSYVKAAADGLNWSAGTKLPDASTPERLHIAISNLAFATRTAPPLFN